MFVEDATEWNPEYISQLNKHIRRVYMDTYITENMTIMDYTIKCSPKISPQNIVENVLLCHAHKTIVPHTKNRMLIKSTLKKNMHSFLPYEKTNIVRDQLFEIELDRQHERKFKVVAKKSNPITYYDITDIIDQVNIGIDLSMTARNNLKNYENMTSGSYIISAFTQYEEKTRRITKCNASWIITYTSSNQYNEDKELWFRKNDRKFGFQLQLLLPISYTNLEVKTFLVERTEMACTHFHTSR